MRKRILAVSSGGGHWVQLLRLRPVLERHDLCYVTVQADYRAQVLAARFFRVTDATRWSRWDLIKMVFEVSWIVLKERPDVVISTGAAPGVVALRVGKWLGARTIWLDSMANVETMSMSGRQVKKFADLWLTQWSHLACDDGPQFFGAVM